MASTSHDTAVPTEAVDRKTVLNQRTNGLKDETHGPVGAHGISRKANFRLPSSLKQALTS